MNKINLDLPVDAYDADGNLKEGFTAPVSEEISTEGSQPKEGEIVVEPKIEEGGEEQRVPYSRFSKQLQRAIAAEHEAEEARAYVRELESQRNRIDTSRTEPSELEKALESEITSLYGDTPQAKKIIEIQINQLRRIEQTAEDKAYEALTRRERMESQAIAQNENELDNRLSDFSAQLGRDLSPKEEEALLEIVDEYTPTGNDGKYTGEILSFDRAWEVLELRQAKAGSSSKQARNSATRVTGSRSEGEPSGGTSEENNKNFNPLNWKSYYDRISNGR